MPRVQRARFARIRRLWPVWWREQFDFCLLVVSVGQRTWIWGLHRICWPKGSRRPDPTVCGVWVLGLLTLLCMEGSPNPFHDWSTRRLGHRSAVLCFTSGDEVVSFKSGGCPLLACLCACAYCGVSVHLVPRRASATASVAMTSSVNGTQVLPMPHLNTHLDHVRCWCQNWQEEKGYRIHDLWRWNTAQYTHLFTHHGASDWVRKSVHLSSGSVLNIRFKMLSKKSSISEWSCYLHLVFICQYSSLVPRKDHSLSCGQTCSVYFGDVWFFWCAITCYLFRLRQFWQS